MKSDIYFRFFWDQLKLPFTMKLLKKNNLLSDLNLHALHGKKTDVVCIKLMALISS